MIGEVYATMIPIAWIVLAIYITVTKGVDDLFDAIMVVLASSVFALLWPLTFVAAILLTVARAVDA